jgi:hypothetical protein
MILFYRTNIERSETEFEGNQPTTNVLGLRDRPRTESLDPKIHTAL